MKAFALSFVVTFVAVFAGGRYLLEQNNPDRPLIERTEAPGYQTFHQSRIEKTHTNYLAVYFKRFEGKRYAVATAPKKQNKKTLVESSLVFGKPVVSVVADAHSPAKESPRPASLSGKSKRHHRKPTKKSVAKASAKAKSKRLRTARAKSKRAKRVAVR